MYSRNDANNLLFVKLHYFILLPAVLCSISVNFMICYVPVPFTRTITIYEFLCIDFLILEMFQMILKEVMDYWNYWKWNNAMQVFYSGYKIKALKKNLQKYNSNLTMEPLDKKFKAKSKNKASFGSVEVDSGIILVSQNPDLYQCKICKNKFTTKAHINYHKYCGKGEDDKPFTCGKCNRGFITKAHYEYHLGTREHSGNDNAEVSYTRTSNSNSKPRFTCSKCGKGFVHQKSAIRHLQLRHSRTKNTISDSESDVSVNRKKGKVQKLLDLKHISIIKDANDEKQYRCKICSKKFRTMAHIKYHEFCGKDYSWTQKPFKCEKCCKGFITSSHYDYHLTSRKHREGKTRTREPSRKNKLINNLQPEPDHVFLEPTKTEPQTITVIEGVTIEEADSTSIISQAQDEKLFSFGPGPGTSEDLVSGFNGTSVPDPLTTVKFETEDDMHAKYHSYIFSKMEFEEF